MHDVFNRLGVTGSADNVVKHKPPIISKTMLMVQPVSVIKISAENVSHQRTLPILLSNPTFDNITIIQLVTKHPTYISFHIQLPLQNLNEVLELGTFILFSLDIDPATYALYDDLYYYVINFIPEVKYKPS